MTEHPGQEFLNAIADREVERRDAEREVRARKEREAVARREQERAER